MCCPRVNAAPQMLDDVEVLTTKGRSQKRVCRRIEYAPCLRAHRPLGCCAYVCAEAAYVQSGMIPVVFFGDCIQ